jgi:hypothetical protein
MKRPLVVVIIMAFAMPCFAQSPTPGPEVQKLADFLGMWKAEGELNRTGIVGGPIR